MSTHFEIEVAKLTLSTRYQARKTPGQVSLSELADSIEAQGLLQNLVVTKGKKRGTYEVIAGGRRLQAMQRLIESGRWAKETTVWVTQVDNEQALEASITENVQREAMHPADEFEAFAALVDQGTQLHDLWVWMPIPLPVGEAFKICSPRTKSRGFICRMRPC